MGGNTLMKVFNPITWVLPKEQAVWFDPMTAMVAQSFQNVNMTLQGQEKFGQHKDWFGGGENFWFNKTMRTWTEGKNYKQWDEYRAQEKNRMAGSNLNIAGVKAPTVVEKAPTGLVNYGVSANRTAPWTENEFYKSSTSPSLNDNAAKVTPEAIVDTKKRMVGPSITGTSLIQSQQEAKPSTSLLN